MHGKSNRHCASFFAKRLAIANHMKERGGLYQTVSFYHSRALKAFSCQNKKRESEILADDILITRIDEPIYTKLYKVSGPLLCGHKVDIYAECQENLNTEGENDYYLLSFYLSADDYGAREHIVGIPFGHSGMSQKEIDQEVVHWLQGYVLNDLMDDIHMYLKKEALFEEWLDKNSQD